MICPHSAVLNSAAMSALTPQPHHKRQSRAAGSCSDLLSAIGCTFTYGWLWERISLSRGSPGVKDIGHREVYDILQSRKPRSTIGGLWGKRFLAGLRAGVTVGDLRVGSPG